MKAITSAPDGSEENENNFKAQHSLGTAPGPFNPAALRPLIGNRVIYIYGRLRTKLI
jgi:hypothetical protein